MSVTGWKWEPHVIEGDSAAYMPGQPARLWQEIEDAEKEKAREPKKLKLVSLAEVQADILRIAYDLNNSVTDRLEAFRLSWEMAQFVADLLPDHTNDLRDPDAPV